MLLATVALGSESTPASREQASSPTDAPELKLELNKLEQRGEDCVIWTLLENPSDTDFESLKLELVLFDRNGLIQRRVALETAPLAATKTMAKAFKIAAMRCNSLGRILINDVVACAGEKGPIDDCLEGLKLSSRTEVELIK